MSNPTFDASVAAAYATLTRVVDPAADPLGYGTDLACVLDVTDDFAEVDPGSPHAIVEALLRRYVTPRGSLVDDADYGLDIRGYCNRGVTVADLRALSAQMGAEARKDDRVNEARVDVAVSLGTRTLSIKTVIVAADPALQAFTLTFAVTEAGVLTDTIVVTGAA